MVFISSKASYEVLHKNAYDVKKNCLNLRIYQDSNLNHNTYLFSGINATQFLPNINERPVMYSFQEISRLFYFSC